MVQSLHIRSAKLRKALAQLPYLPRALGLVWQVARPWTIAWMVLLMVQGLLPAATVYLTKLVVDGVIATMKNGGAWLDVRGVLILVATLAGVMLLMEVARSAIGWIRTVQAELLQDHINGLIHAGKSTLVKLLCRFYDPASGKIEIDGTNINQISTLFLRRLITVLFQEPVHYNATVPGEH